MRRSTTPLAHTPVRLAELSVLLGYVHVLRARLVVIHLEKLPHFTKIDRDGPIGVLKDATQDHRFLLQEFGFCTLHPGTVQR